MNYKHQLLQAITLMALTFPAASQLLFTDPWRRLDKAADLWDVSMNDIAISREMRQLEIDYTKTPLQLAQLLDKLLIKEGGKPEWSMASELKQVKWFGTPSTVNGKTYRTGVAIIGADKITPTRLVDKIYAKSWILTMSGTGGMRFSPVQLSIDILAVYDQGQAINKMPGTDLPRYLRGYGFNVKTACLDSGTQYDIGHFIVKKSDRSLHLLYAYTAGSGQESLTYFVRWGNSDADCKNLSLFGIN